MVCLPRNMAHYLVYIIVLKWFEFKTTVIYLIIHAKLCFWWFVSLLALSCIKWFILGLFCRNLGTQHYFVYIILFKWLELKTIVICFKLRAKFRFWRFLSVFCTFSHKVVRTRFVLHETWNTITFGIYYCVEMVRIKKNSYACIYVLSCVFEVI